MQNKNTPLKVHVSITLDEDVAEEILKRSDNAFRSFLSTLTLFCGSILNERSERQRKPQQKGRHTPPPYSISICSAPSAAGCY